MPTYSLSTPSPDLLLGLGFRDAQLDSTGVIGMAVYIKSNGNFDLARSDVAELQATVAGLLQTAATGGFSATMTTEKVQRSDWTPVIDTLFLTPGAVYYLTSTPGKLSSSPPVAGIVAPVALALSQTEIRFSPQRIVRL